MKTMQEYKKQKWNKQNPDSMNTSPLSHQAVQLFAFTALPPFLPEHCISVFFVYI